MQPGQLAFAHERLHGFKHISLLSEDELVGRVRVGKIVHDKEIGPLYEVIG